MSLMDSFYERLGIRDYDAPKDKYIPNRIDKEGLVRMHYICYGHVQGCGFRSKACQVARGLLMTGYARNLPDGTVELELQGTSEEIGRFFVRLTDDPYIRLERTAATELDLKPDERGFSVRF